MMTQLNLLPQPRSVELKGGVLTLAGDGVIALRADPATALYFTGQRLQDALHDATHGVWRIAAGAVEAAVTLSFDPSLPAQGYQLRVETGGVQVLGGDAAGVFYGVCTLRQLLETYGAALPLLVIDDYPDFPARGVMLDISRDRVPTMETLYALIDLLASWKINQFQLYIEHTFAYSLHHEVWAKASPMTSEQLLALDAYCRERFIDLVPNQNSFGHMHRWFEHPRYLDLAETTPGVEYVTPWGNTLNYPFSLSPAVPGSLSLLEGLYDELLPNFTSRYFNVGCDETIDLGVGKSKVLCEAKGKGRVYLEFLLAIYERVKARGRTMMFWGDIITEYPELISHLPKDSIALEWGYEANHPYPEHSRMFAESGIPFYVCPGTSSWTSLSGRTDNSIGCIRSAVENGLANGAIGVLNTDWGDRGHWQQLPVSYLGFAYGAACSWAAAQNVDIDLPAALDAFAFRDRAGVMGKLVYDLGNIYQTPGILVTNANILYWAYHVPLSEMKALASRLTDPAVLSDENRLGANLLVTLEQIEATMSALDRADMNRPDADLIKRELRLTAHFLRHGARRMLMQLDSTSAEKAQLLADLNAMEADYRALWLARSRAGGLEDSVATLMSAKALYQ